MNNKTNALYAAMESIDSAYLEETLDFVPKPRRTVRHFPRLSTACVAVLVVLGVSVTAFAVSRMAAPKNETAAPVTLTANIPAENIRAEYISADPVPSTTANGVYLLTDKAVFLDFDTDEAAALDVPEENTLNTWWGGSTSLFGEYNGNWYRAFQADSGDIVVECASYTEQTQKIVGSLSDGNGGIFGLPSYMYFSHGYAYIMTVESGSLYRMDLTTGAATRLLRCNKDERFDFLGASEGRVAILYTNYLGSDRDELRLYDFACLNYQVLCRSEDGFITSVDPHVCYGDTLVYQQDTKFMLCDLTSGQVTELCQQESVVNYWLLDGKLFTVAATEDGYTQFYADLRDGDAKELTAQRGTVCIRFSAHQETGEYFIGNLAEANGLYYIKKTDFYAGRFDAATALEQRRDIS